MLNEVKHIAEKCSCGQKHELLTEHIVSEKGAAKQLVRYVKENYNGHQTLVICDENTEKFADPISKELSSLKYVHKAGAHANETETEKLTEYINSCTTLPSVMIACGSGSIHDITRFCAYKAGIPFISFPTAASVDGFVSSVAAMTMYGQKLTYPSAAPKALFADPDIYSSAPARLTASGVGDVIGKITALFDWKTANLIVEEHICPQIYSMMKNALNTIISAVKTEDITSVSFAEKVMNGLILSGLAMQLQGNSRPASGSEHHMSHFWEMHVINDETDALHGEKVGIGTILILDMLKKKRNTLEKSFNTNLEKVFDRSRISEVFGDLTDGILNENIPDGCISSSVLAKTDAQNYKKALDTVKNMIDELPDAEFVSDILRVCGAPVTLSEISLPENEDFTARSLLYSPYVRNRLTLAKIISATSFN